MTTGDEIVASYVSSRRWAILLFVSVVVLGVLNALKSNFVITALVYGGLAYQVFTVVKAVGSLRAAAPTDREQRHRAVLTSILHLLRVLTLLGVLFLLVGAIGVFALVGQVFGVGVQPR